MQENLEAHNQDPEAHPQIKEKLDSLSNVAFSGSYSDLTNKPTIPAKTTVVNNLTSTSTTSALSAYQGKVLKGLIDTTSVAIPDVINNLTSTSTTNALSAYQGKILKGLIDEAMIIYGRTSSGVTLGFEPSAVLATTEYSIYGGGQPIVLFAPGGRDVLTITSTGFKISMSGSYFYMAWK